MKRTWRRLAALVCVPLALILTACARAQATVNIKDENHITMHVTYGMQRAVAQGAHMTEAQLCGAVKPGDQGIPADAQVKVNSDESYIGCDLDFTTDMKTLNEHSGDPVITHDTDKNTWTFHWSAEQAKSSLGAQGEGFTAAQLSDFKVDVTFPGAVSSHNGSSTVKGNTVTWTDPNDFTSKDGLRAESGGSILAGGAAGGLLPWIIGGVVGLLVVVGAVVFFLLRGRKKRAAAAQPQAATNQSAGATQAATPQQQWGAGGQTGQPQQWGQDAQGGRPGQWGQGQPPSNQDPNGWGS